MVRIYKRAVVSTDFYKGLFQVGMDLDKVWKQDRDENLNTALLRKDSGKENKKTTLFLLHIYIHKYTLSIMLSLSKFLMDFNNRTI